MASRRLYQGVVLRSFCWRSFWRLTFPAVAAVGLAAEQRLAVVPQVVTDSALITPLASRSMRTS